MNEPTLLMSQYKRDKELFLKEFEESWKIRKWEAYKEARKTKQGIIDLRCGNITI